MLTRTAVNWDLMDKIGYSAVDSPPWDGTTYESSFDSPVYDPNRTLPEGLEIGYSDLSPTYGEDTSFNSPAYDDNVEDPFEGVGYIPDVEPLLSLLQSPLLEPNVDSNVVEQELK